jgi:hypothetical protein
MFPIKIERQNPSFSKLSGWYQSFLALPGSNWGNCTVGIAFFACVVRSDLKIAGTVL